MSTNLNDDDIDLSMRAPYIPMNENDDLPLLTEDLMWSAFSDEMSLHKSIKDTISSQTQTFDSSTMRKSNLAALLAGQQDNATCKDITKHLTSTNTSDLNHCHLSKLSSNGTSNSFTTTTTTNNINANNSNNGSNHLSTGSNRVTVGLLNIASDINAFNQSHNTQPIDDDSAELIETHDQQKTDDDGIIDTDSIASIHADEYDDDSFPKSCKCLKGK